MSLVSNEDFDSRLRLSAMAWLRAELLKGPGYIKHDRLTEFRFQDERIPLINLQRGIWKPRVLDAALSIRSVYRNRPDERPYADEPGSDGLLRYKWMGLDREASDNRAVRRAMELRLPLIYLVGVAPGLYEPIFPVYIEAEEVEKHQFVVSTSPDEETAWDLARDGHVELARRYIETSQRQRLHQRVFRQQVLLAYESRCSLCRLGHVQLLDAAHIREDSAGGEPTVVNGIAMCKLHHATFDNLLIGITPDYTITVRDDLLEEVDGPTLQHSIKQLHDQKIWVPKSTSSRPDRDLLAERFAKFVENAA